MPATKITLQQHADDVLAAEYKQPLKTVEDACTAVGWEVADSPVCCGQPVEITSMIGPYMAECKTCGAMIRDITGPHFSETGSAVQFLDGEKVDLETDRTWIAIPANQRPA